MNYILIDTSYLIFYRYYALMQWWKIAKPEQELGNPAENPEFREKFKKIMIASVETIKKNLKLHTNKRQSPQVTVIAARDCPRLEIWRNQIYPEYKATRELDDTFMGGPFFKMVYDENLLEKAGCKLIIQEDRLEADDIIAITTKYLKKQESTEKIYIIANDMDYLQLCNGQCDIVNLKMKRLIENKKNFPEADKNLFIKIIMGDKSDNISSVFKKCGIKEAEKLYEDSEMLGEKLEKEDAYEKISLNKMLIDFDEIPEIYVYRVMEKLKFLYIEK